MASLTGSTTLADSVRRRADVYGLMRCGASSGSRPGSRTRAWIQFTPQGGTWTYETTPSYLSIEGKSWPLISNTPPPAPAGSTPLLDVLPSTPVNGQEIYFQTAAMRIDGVMWHFRYNANNPGTYKWDFVGGGWLRHYVRRHENRNSSGTMAYADIATVGPLDHDPARW